ncbi:MAG: DUF1592 domain-containing protein [Deltaproteobacteria bacterium]|nr:DUF1592 domain-containing protein [Deltaproteobacteria bacterium]
MQRNTRAVVIMGALALASGCYTGVGEGRAEGQAEGGSTGLTGAAEAGGSDGDSTGGGAEAQDPGRVTLHRLNRAEYDNTMRDLFWGLDVSPAENFPADDHSFGFDNIADVLSVTSLLFDLYERAVDGVLDAAFTSTGGGETVRGEAEGGTATGGSTLGDAWLLSTTGTVTLPFEVATAGDYTVRVRAWQQAAGPEDAELELTVDGVAHGTTAVAATVDAPGVYEFAVTLDAGTRSISAGFTNDYYDMATSADRNLAVDWIELEAPGGPGGATDVRAKLLTCEPVAGSEATCAREILAAFAPRAWRRPLAPGELDELVALTQSALDEGDGFEDALRHALKAVLLSPYFVFRVEIDPDPESTTPHPVDDYELASRLSYFLWSSMPDDELFAVAEAGTLGDPEVMAEQVVRMIDDERAEALMANFAGQWLYIRAVQPDIVKDALLFPDYDPELNVAMRTEMELFFRSFVTERRSLRELLTAEESFVDARLAGLYGVPAPAGTGFSPVSLAGANRRGILTMAGLMTVLSHPQTSSPVKRGKWVLEQLLCAPPPPPPPNVSPVPAEPLPDASVREQLEEHRKNPSCAGCHNLIDPLGLGLEHYDPIGAYRTSDGGKPVDASGNLPDGTTFQDGLEMVTLLSTRDDFTRCTVQHAATYALGRGMGDADAPYIDEILANAEEGGFALEDLALAIATSDIFRMRQPQEAP